MAALKRNILLILVFFLVLLGFFYRLYGLSFNYSFWTDENHVAIFSRAIVQKGAPVLSNGYSTGVHQWLWYYIAAFSLKVFGFKEIALRFPSVIFGALTIIAVYLLAKKLFNHQVALISAFLVSFLKLEIVYSRQAIPYQAVQFFYLLSFYLFISFLEIFDRGKISGRYFSVWALTAVVASLLHTAGLLAFAYAGLYLIIFRRDFFDLVWKIGKERFRKNPVRFGFPALLSAIFAAGLLWKIGFFYRILTTVFVWEFGKIDFFNQWYFYHSFLWRQYGLLIFLALTGLLLAIIKYKKIHRFFIWVIFFHLLYINFRLPQPFVRYIYLIFPIFILYAAFALWRIGHLFSGCLIRPVKSAIPLFLTLFIIANGFKFSIVPRSVYSVNEDMQEIPEVDYKEIYRFVRQKIADNPSLIFISNWHDHAIWYLGEGYPHFLLRTEPYKSIPEIDPMSGVPYIQSQEELRRLLEKYPQGLILLESWDDRIPAGAREYIRNSLKKEMEIDRLYPVQPRYWPVEIYSWGLEESPEEN